MLDALSRDQLMAARKALLAHNRQMNSAKPALTKSCRVVRAKEAFRGRQGLDYCTGISAESVGAEAICLHLLVMPVGATGKAHYHEAHETAICMLEGVIEFAYGEGLEHVERVRTGDFVYIPAGVWHLPYNPTAQVAKALIACTDPREQ